MNENKKKKYQGVSLPVPFIEVIKNHLERPEIKDKFRGIADYVSTAVREKMERDSGNFHNLSDMDLKESIKTEMINEFKKQKLMEIEDMITIKNKMLDSLDFNNKKDK